MAEEEYLDKNGNYSGPNDGLSGHEWMQLFRKKYPHSIWLNPSYHGDLTRMYWMALNIQLCLWQIHFS